MTKPRSQDLFDSFIATGATFDSLRGVLFKLKYMARGNNSRGGGEDGREKHNHSGRGRGGRSGRGFSAEAQGQPNPAVQGGRGRGGGRGEGGRQGRSNDQQGRQGGRGRGGGRNNENRNNENSRGGGSGNNQQGHYNGGGGGRGRGGAGSNSSHSQASFAASINIHKSSEGVSGEVLRFWKLVHKNLLNAVSPFTTTSSEDCDLWKQCWTAAATGANGDDFPAMSLLQVYVALPDAESIHPSAHSAVSVLRAVVQGVVAHTNTIKVIDTVVSIVNTRLQSSKSLATVGHRAEELIASVTDLKTRLLRCVMRLRLDNPESEPLQQLQKEVDGPLFKTYIDNLNRVQTESIHSEVVVDGPIWTAWRTEPTVGWLMSGAWHQDVPPLQEFYPGGLQEYTATLLRTWTVLTFYWGSAALWPRCKFKTKKNGDESYCDEPLLHHVGHSHNACCEFVKRNGVALPCGGEAVWACHKHSREAVCQRCLSKLQGVLGGSGPDRNRPGPTGASTDIYNAVVTREESRTVGTVFHLTDVVSRKPPRIDPNWRTTYRLQPSALVAVVKLSVSNESLKPEHTLHWAEIVQSTAPNRLAKGPPVHESRFRQERKMAVRLLGRGDIATFTSDPDLPLTTQVAIIDLKVFVPEVISVLATFANPRFGEHLEQIPFARRLIGAEKSPPLLRLPVMHASIGEYTNEAILGSEIRCLRMLPMDRKVAIIHEILNLPPVQNLYGTQLEAFANGLSSALHCTQGPPGTGKSYVGVCIILALVVVRKYVLQNGSPIGPILMLSYKNHALEEFLTDVLKFAPWLKPGQLVRCGKIESPDLIPFSEFNSKEEKESEQKLQKCIQTQRAARAASKAWLELSRGQEYRGPAAEEAVMRVMELFVRLSESYVEDSDDDGSADDSTLDGSTDNIDLIPSLVCANPLAPNAIGDLSTYSEWFSDWVQQAEHWKEVVNRRNADRQVQILLTRWLSGETPPPRCEWSDCEGYAVKDQAFCRRHLCKVAGCKLPHIESDDAAYCDFHTCRADDCVTLRLAAGDLCVDHSCVTCVSQVLAGTGAEVQYVALTGCGCEKHQCQLLGCAEVALLPHTYCKDHICWLCVLLPGPAQLAVENFDHCIDHCCMAENCNMPRLLSVDGAEFCEKHTCRLCNDAIDFSSSESELSMLCADHRCGYPDYVCQHEAVETEAALTERCEYHTCRVCICDPSTEATEWGSVTSDFPRNVCAQHPLCICPLNPDDDTVLCTECAVPASNMCAAHTEEEAQLLVPQQELVYTGECHGVTKKKAKCKAKCPEANQLFCAAHVLQAPTAARVIPHVHRAAPVDRVHTMQAALAEKLAKSSEQLQRDEQMVENTLFQFLLANCAREDCYVSALFPYQGRVDEQWCCALHTAFPLPLAREEEEPAEVELPVVEDPPPVPDMPSHGPAPSSASVRSTPVADADDDYEVVPREDLDHSRPDALGAGQLDPDEMDYEDFDTEGYNSRMPISGTKASADSELDADGEDWNDNQRRLQEIGALEEERAVEDDEVEPDDDVQSDMGADIDSLDDDELLEKAISEAETWSWRWPLQQRQEAVSRLIRLIVKRLVGLRGDWDDVVATARRTKAEAGAATLKRAIIVGATVVGASRRLDTLRAAEPFAAVVEEACEVMEPTLISVLAVKSLQKLELVGDHRQLPAFVQQCWYNLETTMPSIKTSLFERLIGDIRWKKTGRQVGRASSTDVERVPFSVLDEQRRMRSNLADLTRPHYLDVTKITDHAKTATQRLGDTLNFPNANKDSKAQWKTLELHRASWHQRSIDSIPGVTSNVFFWDLPGNQESRPMAGLSACNESEARCVVNIAKFLILCGTPPSSITIITPYKGQKNLIIKYLREAKLLPDIRRHEDRNRDEAVPITVSTVDTFQGDENDIILFSLVRCRPGNRFIELQNRFIVAVSRARLALYIVGCRDAVVKGFKEGAKGPAHWVDFIEHLETAPPAGHEAGAAVVPRVGPNFPVCCPRHLTSTRAVSDSKTLPSHEQWNTFCRQVCTTKLPCTHMCGMLCHSPSLVAHTPKCLKPVARPCEAHSNVALYCGDVKRNRPHEPLADALARFECEVPVVHRRPCGHEVRLTCFLEGQLTRMECKLKDCVEIVDDFVLPCGHRIAKPTCSDRARYQLSAPQCNVRIQHTRMGCNCVIAMSCHESVRELSSATSVKCFNHKEIRRPRCGHSLTDICHVVSPLTEQWNRWNSGIGITHTANPSQLLVVPFSDRYGRPEVELVPTIPECKVKVDYLARCGHRFKNVLCCQAFATAKVNEVGLKVCEANRTAVCFLCDSRDLQVPCWSEEQSSKLAGIVRLQPPTHDSDRFTIEEGTIERFAKQGEVSAAVMNVWKNLCDTKLRIVRRCGHSIDLKCHEVFMYLMHKRKPDSNVIAPCVELIDRVLSCGHVTRVRCCDKTHPEPKCATRNTTEYTFPCGVHGYVPASCAKLLSMRAAEARGEAKCATEVSANLFRCGHAVHVLCHQAAEVRRMIAGGAPLLTPQAVVEYSQLYCGPCDIVKCTSSVSVRFPCGHKRTEVPCHEAFAWVADGFVSAPNCCERVVVKHPVCSHDLEVMCWATKELQSWKPWIAGRPQVDSVQVLDSGGLPTSQNVVFSSTAAPAPLPPGITLPMLRCTVNTTYLRDKCDHTQVVECSDAFWHKVAPCSDPVDRVCPKFECQHRRVIMCHQSGNNEPCQNKVLKMCQRCLVNRTSTECCKTDVQCSRHVEADLCCGHMASWQCGTDVDPRTRGARSVDFCLPCVAPQWSHYAESVSAEKINDAWAPLRALITSKVDPHVKVLQSRALVAETHLHVDARKRIARSVLDALHANAKVQVELPPTAGFLSPAELKSDAYTWVIGRAIGTDENIVENFRHVQSTKFGLGVELEILSAAALRDVFRAKANGDDSVTVCIGVVYSRKVHSTSDPFVASTAPKEHANALRMVASQRATGLFDAVQFTPRGQKAGSERRYCISWETGAAVPLAVLTIQQKAECGVCCDSYSTSEGFACPRKCSTFTCWDCLTTSYAHAAKPDAIQGRSNKEGELLCMDNKCKCPIKVADLSKCNASAEVLKAYEDFKLQVQTRAEVAKQLKLQEDRIRAEYARIEEIKDVDEKVAAKLRLKIVDEVLTFRCPRCKTAFVDFEGCFALSCGNSTCRSGFCAWCLKDCGSDAHSHVARCPENKGQGYFNTEDVFQAHHRGKRTATVKKLIADAALNRNASAKLFEAVRRDLEDLHIRPTDVFPAAQVAVPAPVPAPAPQFGLFGFFQRPPPPAAAPVAEFYNPYDDYHFDD